MPISTMYLQPRERVLFNDLRDANPFFHFMESLWILGGREDVAWLAKWLSSIKDYSDDGSVFHGAYGARLLNNHQLDSVLHRLRVEKHTTRAVLQIYDQTLDRDYIGKDMPCNCMIFLGLHGGKLNITVANRSNDMIWGAYGTNVVQFSMLQEYLANKLECQVGWYVQMSNNAHVYPDNEVAQRLLNDAGNTYQDPYISDDEEELVPYPLNAQTNEWDRDLHYFLNNVILEREEHKFKTRFFRYVAYPMAIAHAKYREKQYNAAITCATYIEASDWRKACVDWLVRRREKAGVHGERLT